MFLKVTFLLKRCMRILQGILLNRALIFLFSSSFYKLRRKHLLFKGPLAYRPLAQLYFFPYSIFIQLKLYADSENLLYAINYHSQSTFLSFIKNVITYQSKIQCNLKHAQMIYTGAKNIVYYPLTYFWKGLECTKSMK